MQQKLVYGLLGHQKISFSTSVKILILLMLNMLGFFLVLCGQRYILKLCIAMMGSVLRLPQLQQVMGEWT